ncbi:hypothetical protein MKEN_00163500 [Mycena kentingensis (nom. inval.)]|nr:hypothetical protein MKEN_00163500 [Mycena kentingensis (nom. inval.)]
MDDRARTPSPTLTGRDSLYATNATLDDLTTALESVSRAQSPEPSEALACCCGDGECGHLVGWLKVKAGLEARLTLSAEVGQALLARAEAYARREQMHTPTNGMVDDSDADTTASEHAAHLQDQLDEVTKENKALEKRLTHALVNSEVSEVSHRAMLQELAEAKTTISRLSTSAARSVGWDTRLSAAMKEKDDMQQERDSESQRARLAESRFAALKERTSKLQSDVRRLQNALEERREHRLESSESILEDARKRIDALSRTVGEPTHETPELTSMLATLVDDNETLKRDNAELQTLLADAREDHRALQEEMEDQRVNPPPPRSGAATPSHLRTHFHTSSVGSVMLSPASYFRRSSSTERRSSRRYEPLTPETTRRPLSPADSLANSDTKWSSLSQPPRYPVSPSIDAEEDVQDERRTAHKPLFLLSRSRGVQTDPAPPYPPSHSPSSNASVYSESLAPTNTVNPANALTIAAIVERTTALLQRIQSADAWSLTNRLKRQQIRGADVGHLSRTTVAGIVADAGRQLRGAQQEEEIRAHRRDVRALLTVLREMFGALGEMRVVLNEVVLDPAKAARISEAVMDPGKAKTEDGAGANGAGAMGWIASKLFAGAPTSAKQEPERATTASSSTLAAPRPIPARFVPKLGPALAASATTVNVEFSGARAMTSAGTATTAPVPIASPSPAPPGVMGIFAGAPRTKTPDPWIVVPHPKVGAPPRRNASLLHRPVLRQHPNRMSRNVDAILDGTGVATPAEGADVDGEEADYVGPLLARRLRRRGLSDSSIHSTFASHAEEDAPAAPMQGGWLEGLTRRVKDFRSGLSGEPITAPLPVPETPRSGRSSMKGKARDSGAPSLSGSEAGTSPPRPAAPIAIARRPSTKRRDPILKTSASISGFNFLPGLANLAHAGEGGDIARSLREGDGLLAKARGLGPERDYM